MPKFAKNDLVYAKVKGYPPWPAIITEYNIKNKKYEVKFYGTGETGNIKEEDLRHYLESKEEIAGKNARRKDYLDAVAEIKKASDLEKEPVKIKKEVAEKLGKKRKSILESENVTPKRVVGKRKTTEKSNDDAIKDDTVEDKMVKNIKIEDKEEKNADAEALIDSSSKSRSGRMIRAKRISSEEESSPPPKKPKTPKLKANKSAELKESSLNNEEKSDSNVVYSVVPIENLEILLKYYEAIKDKEDDFKKKAPEDLPPPCKNAQVVLALAPENATLIGVKYNEKNVPKYQSEFERAEYESKEARRVIDLKSAIESGTKSMKETAEFCILLEGKVTESVRNTIIEDSLFQKQQKLKFLQIENSLLKCDCRIKSSLGLYTADPKIALEHLDTMLKLPVEPLMLKKHPQVFEMIKQLQRYVGNVQVWNMEQVEADAFMETAKNIRVQADQVFHKFMTLMLKVLPSIDQLNVTIFWTIYMKEVERFKKETSHLKENEIFVLSAEPYSRASILDSLYQEHDISFCKSFNETPSVVHEPSSTTTEVVKND